MFNSCVLPINDYCSGVWAGNSVRNCTTDIIQNRAIRFYLGVHKFASNHVINGDMGWEFSSVRRKIEMLRLWNRFLSFDDTRLTKNVYIWDKSLCAHNWSSEIKVVFVEMNMVEFFEQCLPVNLQQCKSILHNIECDRWHFECLRKPKLRTYIQMKFVYEKESYVSLDLNRTVRSFIARLRTGTLLLMVEVGRFRGVELENRICPICFSEVEDEIHFLFKCQYYNHLRAVFYNNIVAKGYRDFRLSS